jgi:cobalamin 5'-phosphate synthase/cobalamin synthase
MKGALSFLTVLGRAARPDERTLTWFPIVGIAVGAIVGLVWWAAGRLWPAALAATLAVAADAIVTGCLHLDGVADAADGLLPAVERSRRLEIMADPRVGAFGAVALILVLFSRTASLAATPPKPLVVIGLWCASRTLMAVVARAVPYARDEGGMASSFVGDATQRGRRRGLPPWAGVAAYGMAAALALAVAGAGLRGLAVIVAAVLGMAAVVWLAQRRIGGYTGDVLGAGGVLAETLGLLVLAAR